MKCLKFEALEFGSVGNLESFKYLSILIWERLKI